MNNDDLARALGHAAQQFTPLDHAASAWRRGRALRRRRLGTVSGLTGLAVAAAAGGIYVAGGGLAGPETAPPAGTGTATPPGPAPTTLPDPSGPVATSSATESEPPPTAACSADGLNVGPLASGDAPEAATDGAQQVLEAVLSCDSELLIERAGVDGTVLGLGDASPDEVLALPESDAERYRLMAQLLTSVGDPAEVDAGEMTVWRWPALSGDEASDRALLADAGLYTAEELDVVFIEGEYYGWRIAFTDEGRWQYLTAGD